MHLGLTTTTGMINKMVNAKVVPNVQVGNAADPVVTRLVEEDKVPWYKKPNLRVMYIFLFLCCMGVEMTSGFDSQLINTLQFAEPFLKCMLTPPPPLPSPVLPRLACFCFVSVADTNSSSVFGGGRVNEEGKYAIEPGMLGFINSSYQLGSIFGVPIAPWFAHRYGRRWSIMLGSIIMVIGALLQGFAQHGMDSRPPPQSFFRWTMV